MAWWLEGPEKFTAKKMMSVLDDFANHAHNEAQLQKADALDFMAIREKIKAADRIFQVFVSEEYNELDLMDACEAYLEAGSTGGRRD